MTRVVLVTYALSLLITGGACADPCPDTCAKAAKRSASVGLYRPKEQDGAPEGYILEHVRVRESGMVLVRLSSLDSGEGLEVAYGPLEYQPDEACL